MGKKILFYLIGISVACMGVTFMIKSNVGAGPWDVVNIGLVNKIGLTFGTWVIIWQIFFLLFNAVLLKKRPEFESIITVVFWGLMMDFWMEIVFQNLYLASLSPLMRWGSFLFGVLLIGVGVGIYLTSNLPRMPYDGTMIAISSRFKLGLNVSRTFLEGTAVIIAVSIGGKIGVGTVVIVLIIGSIIEFFNKISLQLYDHKFSFKQ